MSVRMPLFLLCTALQVIANGADLKILYVYTEAATAEILNNPIYAADSIDNPGDHMTRINTSLQAVITNSGITNVAAVSLGATVLNAGDWNEGNANNNANEIVGALNETTNGFDVGGTNLNDLMIANMADIVVLVTNDLHDIATTDRNGDGVINAADNRQLRGISCQNKNPAGDAENCYGMVLDVSSVDSNTIAHELGHMAGADHVDPDNPGAPVITVGSGNVARPYIASDTSYATVMADGPQCSPPGNSCIRLPIYSDPNVSYTSTGGTTYNTVGSSTRKTKALIAPILTIMTGYHEARNPSQPPATPTGSAYLISCNGNSGTFNNTIGPGSGSGGPATSYEMQRRLTYNGIWLDYYLSIHPSCLPYTTTSYNIWFRVRATNSAGSSNYKTYALNNNCDEGQNGW